MPQLRRVLCTTARFIKFAKSLFHFLKKPKFNIIYSHIICIIRDMYECVFCICITLFINAAGDIQISLCKRDHFYGTHSMYSMYRDYKRKTYDPPTFKDLRYNEKLVADDEEYRDVYSTVIFR